MKIYKLYAPIALLLVLLFGSCSNGSPAKTSPSAYFDLKAYFEAEAIRLKQANPNVRKTVAIDHSSEEKLLKIDNWTKELTVFIDADINKTAWRGLFAVERHNDIERYTAQDQNIPVQQLIIQRKAGKINSIEISLTTKTTLYTSIDKLKYYPDSLYEIKKTQTIQFKDPKTYLVRGIFIDALPQPPVRSVAAPLR